MTPAEVRQTIVAAMHDWVAVADRPTWEKKLADPNQDVRFEDLDVDSLAAAEISMAVEDATGYACDIAEFLAYPTIQTLSDHIAKELASSRS